jgi:hypothetical protein
VSDHPRDVDILAARYACEIQALVSRIGGLAVHNGGYIDSLIENISVGYHISVTVVARDLYQKMDELYPETLKDTKNAACVRILFLSGKQTSPITV